MTSAASLPGKASKGWTRRLWLWLCAVVFGAVVGVLNVPETGLRSLSATARMHRVASHVAVVAIDDKSLAELGQWPFPRSVSARLTDRLFALGAKRVFLVINFVSPQTRSEDEALVKALRRHKGSVYLAARLMAGKDRRLKMVEPYSAFASEAKVANVSYSVDNDGNSSELPYADMVSGVKYDGVASIISGRQMGKSASFPVDTSIDISSIKIVSMVDVLKGRALSSNVSGKDVLIGATSDQLQDMSFVPSYGRIPATLLLALGAETLFEGTPRDYSWLPIFLLSTLSTFMALCPARRLSRVGWLLIIAGAMPFLPFVVPTYWQIDVLPGISVLLCAAFVEAYRLLRQSLKERATTNQISGLSNLIALRQLGPQTGLILVVGRVHNFAEATAALPPEDEATLVAQIASRLKLGTTGTDLYNGDNGVFAWFASDDVATLGERLDGLHALFRSPVTVSAQNVDLNVTFGFDDDDERSIANRLGSALVAAAEAHADGAKWREFDKSKLADAAWKLSLLSQLDAAIDDGHLWVAYQPKLDLASRRIVGAEALVRWTHPEKGAISPIEFVAAAEQHNRIEKLTLHVLDRAVLACATINAHGIPFGIAVNLSTRLLESHDIVDAVTATLAEHRLDPARLTLEITETATLTSATSLEVLAELRALGLRISIDDYGTGLSTLDYLKKIPASEIKIDRSFVQSMLSGASDLLMVNSTIQLAHSLGHVVVAEGVETDEVLARLADLQCDIAQGYRIGRPMMFQDLARRLLAERRRAA